MLKRTLAILLLCISFCAFAQVDSQNKTEEQSKEKKKDSLKKRVFLENIGLGYFPIKYFNFDLRYLVKFNQFEGFRTGIGGITSDQFSDKFRLNGYLVYGFADKTSKYSFGGGFRVNEKTDTWVNLTYTDDLQETGSSKFLTDKRFFSFFEPRLLNIDLFHRHITKSISLQHRVTNHLLSETQLSVSRINPTYNYNFINNGESFNTFNLSTAQLSLQWSPFSKFEIIDRRVKESLDGYPKFTAQVTQSISDVFNSDFNFTKIDFRSIHQIQHSTESFTRLTLVAGMAEGETPLTHLYHAYPNNITKETILQRFSVAGLNSFETMFFNEFFSDRFATFQFKHFFKPFKISERYQPQLVLISRYALGNMRSIDKHQGINFGTLDKLYSESGFEINKLIWAFGLSFAYRYGGYHIPTFEDNIAVKFTFNISL
ncbi:hypothetical protein BTO05_10070 [Winogradskyella sp. PC-19]|uniref:DUF5686 family protein n=1 Tax=unclassified Winogradskyella TaxID=2615021 RepID=UPI000B581311|nr:MULTISPECIES: DUF5686 family protein [unclassified Winogradskyella]ARV09964.1 hypothetical protein BTO05_10070 [Winogradskyella sp. PC-19]